MRPPQTKTQRQKQADNEIAKAAQLKLNALAKEEFPIGSRVKWIHTFKRNGDAQWLDGTVAGHGYGLRFEITRDNGTVYFKEPSDLFPCEVTEQKK